MQCEIAGNRVSCEELGLRDMNFGQPVPGLEILRFEIIVDAQEFFSACTGVYRDFAEDDIKHGEPEEESSLLEMRRLGWPPLEAIFNSHPALGEKFFNSWMSYNTLEALLSARKPVLKPKFVANEVSAIRIQGAKLHMSGLAIAIDVKSYS